MTRPRFASRRVRAMPASVFATMDRAKSEARRRGLDVIDLSIGSSDLPPPPAALAAIRDAAHDPATHGYCLHAGTRPLREAAVAWYRRRYGLELDPDREALALIGAQEGFASLLLAVTDPGDAILLPEPGYPSWFGAVALAGLERVPLPLSEANRFLPDLASVPDDAARRAKVLVLSYPNNPTAATATAAFFASAVAWCERHDLLLLHDFPYVDLVFGGADAPSALAAAGSGWWSCSRSARASTWPASASASRWARRMRSTRWRGSRGRSTSTPGPASSGERWRRSRRPVSGSARTPSATASGVTPWFAR